MGLWSYSESLENAEFKIVLIGVTFGRVLTDTLNVCSSH